jgi:hypothetical protein
MIVYTGDVLDLQAVDQYIRNSNRIEVFEDGAGVKFIPQEVITCPDFEELKPIFNKLTPIKYTPFPDEND